MNTVNSAIALATTAVVINNAAGVNGGPVVNGTWGEYETGYEASSAALAAFPFAVMTYEVSELPDPIIEEPYVLDLEPHEVGLDSTVSGLTNHFALGVEYCDSFPEGQEFTAIETAVSDCANQGELKNAWSSLKDVLDCVQTSSENFGVTLQRGAMGAGMRIALQAVLDFWFVHYENIINLDLIRNFWGQELSILPCILDLVFYQEDPDNYVMGNEIELSGLIKELYDLTTSDKTITIDDVLYLYGYYFDIVMLGVPADLPAKFSIGKCNITPNLITALEVGPTANWALITMDQCPCELAAKEAVENASDQWVIDRVKENEAEIKQAMDVFSNMAEMFLKSIFSNPTLQPMVCPGATKQMIPVEWLHECPNKIDIDAFAEMVIQVLDEGLDATCSKIEDAVCDDDTVELFPVMGKISDEARQAVRPLVEHFADMPKAWLNLVKDTCNSPPVEPANLDIKSLKQQGEIIFYSAIGLGAALGTSVIVNIAQAVSRPKRMLPAQSGANEMVATGQVIDDDVKA